LSFFQLHLIKELVLTKAPAVAGAFYCKREKGGLVCFKIIYAPLKPKTTPLVTVALFSQ
tara:strand:- start:193 stop:369 length:177 start_codon:yes stop_codon:yes gene_type:complete